MKTACLFPALPSALALIAALGVHAAPALDSASDPALLGELARTAGQTVDASGNLIPAPLDSRTSVLWVKGRAVRVPIAMRYVPAQPASKTPAFFAGTYEVTQAEYSAFLAANPLYPAPLGWTGRLCPESTANFPVVGISHRDAVAYCRWITEQTGRPTRLPSKEQQEILKHGAQATSANRLLHAVGSIRQDRNTWGCYDVIGNASELCAAADTDASSLALGFRLAMDLATAPQENEIPGSMSRLTVAALEGAAVGQGPTLYYGPYFVTHPQSQAVPAGSNVILNSSATSFLEESLQYRWYFNDAPIPGAIGRSYAVANFQPADVGVYYVEAIIPPLVPGQMAGIKGQLSGDDSPTALALTQSDPAFSDPAVVVIGTDGSAPAITRQPASTLTVLRGDTALVTATFKVAPPFAVRWKVTQSSDFVNFSRVTDLSDIQFTSTESSATASYRNPPVGTLTRLELTVFGAYGKATSSTAEIRVLAEGTAPRIISQPSSQTVARGANVALQITVDGVPSPALQWYRNGSPISGANGDTLALSNVQDADSGTYVVTAANSLGSVTSAPASLSLSSPPPSGSSPGAGGGGGASSIGFLIAVALLLRFRRK